MIEIIIYGIPGYDETAVMKLFQDDHDARLENIENKIIFRVVQPSDLHLAVRAVVSHGHKFCLVFVIQKGRIREEVHRLTEQELNLIFDGSFPVILLITGCTSDTDQHWWMASHSHFAPYGIPNQFDQVIHGTTDEFRGDRWRRTQEIIFDSVIQHAEIIDPELLKINNNFNPGRIFESIYSHFQVRMKFYAVLVPVILLSIAAGKYIQAVGRPPGLTEISTTPRLEELYEIIQRHKLQISKIPKLEAEILRIPKLEAEIGDLKEQLSQKGLMLTTLTAIVDKIKAIFQSD